MTKKEIDRKRLNKIVADLLATYTDGSGTNFIDVADLPVRESVVEILDLLMELLFPGYTGSRKISRLNIEYVCGDIVCQIYDRLRSQIERALLYNCKVKKCQECDCDCPGKAIDNTMSLLGQMPAIRELLKGDVAAAFEGDPAALSLEEIVISYPGLLAIAYYRIAHQLYKNEVPLIPRMITEAAHAKTGVDIHPGATIGKRFFIDHGTGVVIGETAVIGDNVQIYQGVTLGAMAPAKGQRLKGIKRHPTIEDNVVLYAEATILGDIVIGEKAIVSGNVWINHSIDPGVVVSNTKTELVYKKHSPKK